MAREYPMLDQHAGRRVDRIILSDCGVSKKQYARLKALGGVLLDGRQVHADVRVQAGQRLTLCFETDTQSSIPKPTCILYENDDIVVVNKPAPLSTMRSPHQKGETLEDILTPFLGVFRPVNRLDKGTSGLMVVAKNANAQYAMQKLLHTEAFVREYIAVVDQKPPHDAGCIDFPIKKAPSGILRVIAEDGKPSRTYYQVLEKTAQGRWLVKIKLETGRTHQIRVHFAAENCPVTGDYLYGKEIPELQGRFALHSHHLVLCSPIFHEKIEFTAPLPAVFHLL